ncbi:hypothetical protein Y032_0373g186 [Ancylostoma ceylanicum]|uniref:Uncharacterized protein n=1 Tax=Ancylostoma ceylanicum TaxID=53326 RepID=A0A016RU44_9BILA|nr:hypothetical protein Y032_0373g186 [Ancylostoma ceylanicum]
MLGPLRCYKLCAVYVNSSRTFSATDCGVGMFHVHNFEWTFEARDLLSSTKWSAGGEEIAVDSRLNETDFVKTAQEFRTKKNRSRAPFVTGNLELMLNKRFSRHDAYGTNAKVGRVVAPIPPFVAPYPACELL